MRVAAVTAEAVADAGTTDFRAACADEIEHLQNMVEAGPGADNGRAEIRLFGQVVARATTAEERHALRVKLLKKVKNWASVPTLHKIEKALESADPKQLAEIAAILGL